MAFEVAHTVSKPSSATKEGHRAWVRTCHWVGVLSFVALVCSGIFIFAVHPRLYWGEVGNSLTPALLEIPITANHQPDGWQRAATFPLGDGDIFSATRNYPIFNQNGWARSLHFLAGWLLVAAGLVYFFAGIVTGHARKNLLPKIRELKAGVPLDEARKYLKGDFGVSGGGAPYGFLQRLSYSIVIFLLFPLMIMTGMTMSPAMTAAFPLLLDVFGGFQSARTIHFFMFAALVLFLLVHVAMVVLTGAARQLRAMTWGR